MSAQPWTPEFQDEMRKLVATEIDPALHELRQKLGDVGRELGTSLITTTPKAAPLPMVATLATGMSPTISLAAGAGVAAVSSFATYLNSRRTARRHGLYFLLEAERRTR